MAPREGPSATITFVVDGPIARADIPALCEQARAALQDCGARVMLCDLGPRVGPDAVAVDALARLQLTVRRMGREVRLGRVGDDLLELIVLMGLADVVPRCGD